MGADIIVHIIMAILTFFSILVALFKENIYEFFNKPKIIQSLPNEFIENFIYDEEESSENFNDKVVESYKLNSLLINKGNKPCLNCYIQIEKIEYKNENDPNLNMYEKLSHKPLKWLYNENSLINLSPYGAEASCNIIKILSPTQKSRGKNLNTNTKPILMIDNQSINYDSLGSTIKITFSFYSENHKSMRKHINFEWNGKWENRLSEFKKNIKVKEI